MIRRWVRLGLIAGVAGPAAYFLIQPLLIPFLPGYDWTRQVVSELGEAGAPTAAVFNPVILVIGLAMIGGGLAQAAALSTRVATVVAGLFPLPSPRHAAGAVLIPAGMIYPLLAVISFGRWPLWRADFLICVLAVAAAGVVMLGWIDVHRERWPGLIQRPTALTVYGPMALACWALLRGLGEKE